MKKIKEIDGLTVEIADEQRVVRFHGQICPKISSKEVLCEQQTSYYGDILDLYETWQTPVGVVERHYAAHGPGLERQSINWRLIPVTEIEEAQKEFLEASKRIEEARSKLEMLVKQ